MRTQRAASNDTFPLSYFSPQRGRKVTLPGLGPYDIVVVLEGLGKSRWWKTPQFKTSQVPANLGSKRPQSVCKLPPGTLLTSEQN